MILTAGWMSLLVAGAAVARWNLERDAWRGYGELASADSQLAGDSTGILIVAGLAALAFVPPLVGSWLWRRTNSH